MHLFENNLLVVYLNYACTAYMDLLIKYEQLLYAFMGLFWAGGGGDGRQKLGKERCVCSGETGRPDP